MRAMAVGDLCHVHLVALGQLGMGQFFCFRFVTGAHEHRDHRHYDKQHGAARPRRYAQIQAALPVARQNLQ